MPGPHTITHYSRNSKLIEPRKPIIVDKTNEFIFPGKPRPTNNTSEPRRSRYIRLSLFAKMT